MRYAKRSIGWAGLAVAALMLGTLMPRLALSQQPISSDEYRQMVTAALDYLESEAQAEDGSFSGEVTPAITALVAKAAMRSGRPPSDPMVARALEYLEEFVQPDGGIYNPDALLRNYETCLAMACMAEANSDGRYDETITAAMRFVKGLQWDQSEGKDPSDPYYGGAGYGHHARPDMSNTSYLVDALRAAGAPADDEAIQKALVFVSRCQNLESPHNTTQFADKNPDGGFYYTIAEGGESKAGETPAGGLRSYGSMTYAGLKSFIYAGLDSDDPRVRAATEWIRSHYDLSTNPGLGAQGLYYYYHTVGKALDARGEPTLAVQGGQKRSWRKDLATELARRQRPNGSWINDESDRWMESNPMLVTGYALLALSYCQEAFE